MTCLGKRDREGSRLFHGATFFGQNWSANAKKKKKKELWVRYSRGRYRSPTNSGFLLSPVLRRTIFSPAMQCLQRPRT